MKKTVLLLIMSIALFGCGQDAIDDQLSSEEVTIINELVSTVIDNMITESSNGTTPPDSLVLFNQIEAVDGVTSAQFNPSGTILSVQLKDGTSSHILVVTGDNELWFDNSESEAENAVNSVLTKANEQNYIVPMGDKKALILAPFAFQATGINYIDYNSIYNTLSVAGFQVDSFMNKNASIQRFRGDFLSQYDIILINTHGGVLADNGTVLVTGTLLEESYSILSNAELAKCRRIVVKKVPYIAITPDWIEYTTISKFNNSWVFVVGCTTSVLDDLYTTFFSLGAEAFNGFNFTVPFFAGNKFLNNMVSQFSSGKTFQEASEYTANNTPIGYYSSFANLWFYMFGRNQTEDSSKRFDAFQKHEDIPFYLVLPEGYQRTPSVIIKDVHSITNNSASISCEVTFEGAARVTTCGICWSTSENPDMSNSTTTDGMGLGTYTSNITGLSPNTTYYVRPYATNAEGTKIGVQRTFTTTAQQATPTVTTGNVTNISTTTATCPYNVTADGGSAVTERGVCWSTSEEPDITDSKTEDGEGTGAFTSDLSGLNPNTTYYVRAYATNAQGTGYGGQKTFKTNQEEGDETCVYQVTQMGTLGTILNQTQKDTITTMIVRGEINKADFEVMRSQMPQLIYIDLKDVICEGDKIPDKAFGNLSGTANKKIRKIILPHSITRIGTEAFALCTGLTGTLTLPEGLTTIGEAAFVCCRGFTGSLTLPEGLTTIGRWAFDSCSGFNGTLTLPDGLTYIGTAAFTCCSGFTGSLTLPEGLTTIGGTAFSSCWGFTGSLNIPDGLTYIGSAAFQSCSGFTSLNLPEGLTSIQGFLFNGCSGFTGTLNLPDGLTSIGEAAFASCSGFTGTLNLPDGLTTIGATAFRYCSGFSELVMGNNITTIGESAFFNCSNFSGHVIFPISLISIRNKGFLGCNKVDTFHFPHTTPPTYYTDMLPSGATVEVPTSAVDTYKATDGWKDYNIVGY